MESHKEALRSTLSSLGLAEDTAPDLAQRSGKAAERLRRTLPYRESRRVLVSLDRALVQVRLNVLSDRKKLVIPTRAMKDGFLTVDPEESIPPRKRLLAVQPHPGNAFARKNRHDVPLEPPIDLIITGALAVGRDGTRLGDGQGHLDLQFAILRELAWLHPQVQIMALVTENQIHASLPIEAHDIGVQWIVTPDGTIPTSLSKPLSPGVIWERLTQRQIKRNSALFYLRNREWAERPQEKETFS